MNESISLATSQVRSHSLSAVLTQIQADLELGRPVADSFARFPFVFDELFTSILRAGEISGDLESSFSRIAEYRERYDEFVKKLRSALTYPLLVLSVALLVVLAIVFYIIPIFSSLYENFGAELPPLTKLVISISTALKSGTFISVVILAAMISLALLWLIAIRYRETIHRSILKTPVIGKLIVRLITARYCRTLGSLLVADVDIIFALQVASKTSKNLHVSSSLDRMQNDLIAGKSFTESLDRLELFPGVMLKLSAAGEKTGQLGEMLLRAASYYESETSREISTITSLLEPVVIVVLGLLIGLILVALYLPLFSLVGSI